MHFGDGKPQYGNHVIDDKGTPERLAVRGTKIKTQQTQSHVSTPDAR